MTKSLYAFTRFSIAVGLVAQAPAASAALFQVWAPQADSVSVLVDGGRWPEAWLQKEPNGRWSLDLPAALPGDRYRFVLTRGNEKLIRLDPSAVQHSWDGWSVLFDSGNYKWRSDGFLPASLDKAVIYELHVGSFHIKHHGQAGTFSTLSEKLDHLKELGVTHLELMPVHQSARSPNWGYDVSLPNAIDNSYGSAEDFQRLVDEAHARGLGILVDLVHNHYAGDSALVCFDGSCQNDFGPYFYSGEHSQTPWGPRPDFSEPSVQQLISENIRQYLQDFRVDGFRWDSLHYMTRFRDYDRHTGVEVDRGENTGAVDLVRRLQAEAKKWNPRVLQTVEYFGPPLKVTQPLGEGGMGFDSSWQNLWSITKAITEPVVSFINMHEVAKTLPGNSERLIYLESHDDVAHPPHGRRIPSRIDSAHPESWQVKKRSLLGATILMTIPGVPMLFQGQEFLESEDFTFPKGTPLDWTKAQKFRGILQAYKDLIALRKNQAGLTPGLVSSDTEVSHVNEAGKVIAYLRGQGGAGNRTFVIANFGADSYGEYRLGVPHSGTWTGVFSSDDSRYSEDFGKQPVQKSFSTEPVPYDGFANSIVLRLPAFTALVLAKEVI